MGSDKGSRDSVRPIDWIQAVRRWREQIIGPDFEQLVLDGMPDPGKGPARAALAGFIWTWARADDGTGIRPGREKIAAVVGVSERTISELIGELLDAGLLERTKRWNQHSPNEYRLRIPQWAIELGPTTSHTNLEEVGTGSEKHVPRVRELSTALGTGSEKHVPRGDGSRVKVGTGSEKVGMRSEKVGTGSERHPISRSVDQRGSSDSQSSPASDPTHRGKHSPGNPERIGCGICAQEREERENQPTPIPPPVWEVISRSEPTEPTAAYLDARSKIKRATG